MDQEMFENFEYLLGLNSRFFPQLSQRVNNFAKKITFFTHLPDERIYSKASELDKLSDKTFKSFDERDTSTLAQTCIELIFHRKVQSIFKQVFLENQQLQVIEALRTLDKQISNERGRWVMSLLTTIFDLLSQQNSPSLEIEKNK